MLLQTEPRHLLYLIVLLGNIEPLFAINVGTEGVENTKMDGTRDQMTQVRLQARKYFGWLWNFMYSAFEALKRTAVNSYVLPKRPLIENETCYPRVGCFFANESMRLEIGGPQSPEEVNATFYFFDNASSTDVDDLLNDTKKIELPEKTWTLENWTLAAMNNTINFEKPLMVVTHGLTGSKRTPWMEPLVLALLENLNCNVLVVDWEKGANGSYTDAGVNTPMTGAIISLFLQKVINETQCLIRPENITLVGFSMGAQVMGFVGRHFQRTAKMTLGRITGGKITDTNPMLLQTKPRHLVYLIVILGSIEPLFATNVGEKVGGIRNNLQVDGTGAEMTEVRPQARGILDFVWGFVSTAIEAVKNTVIKSYLNAKRVPVKEPACYDTVGCFNHSENMSLKEGAPQSPEEVKTTFYFFNDSSSEDVDELLNENKTTEKPEKTWTINNWTLEGMKGMLDKTKLLTVVTHGLTGSKRTPWMEPLVIALLENLKGTVLVVDWEKGANGSYADAGVNTPMPGVLTSLLLQKIINQTGCSISPDMIYLVGFSMGAQVMGFAGRHFRKTTRMLLGRITGLDPAGYMFEKTNVTLSREDAKFVDVIHTQAGSIYDFKIGLNQSVGHVDFYPNGGSVQEGCPSKISLVAKTFWDDFTCSHYRAPRLFIESLNTSSCPFYSYHSKDWNEFTSGGCVAKANSSDIGIMGYNSNKAAGRGNQYLYTNKQPPYCRENDTSPTPSSKTTSA